MTRPVGVLYIANSGKIGGGNKVLMEMALGLDRARFEPSLVVPAAGPMYEWAHDHHVPVAVVTGGDWGSRRGLFRRTTSFLALAARWRPGVVHALAPMCYRAAGVAATIVGAARVCHLEFPPDEGELEQSFVAGPDAVVTCYARQIAEVEAEVRRLRPSCRLEAIANSVDTARFRPAQLGEQPPTPWPVAVGQRVVLINGHISRVKGHDTFVRAAARIAAAVPDCQFVAMGGDTLGHGLQGELESMAVALGIRDRLHFIGWRNDVPAVLRAADVVVLPSLVEGLPLAVLEAMATGRPVVATPVGGTAEAIVDGESGVLVPPQDSDALAAATISLLRDPARAAAMGRAARRRMEEHYSAERFVQSIQTLYDTLLEKSARRAA